MEDPDAESWAITMTPARDAPIILLAEYYASGGTRTYLKQLLNFYGELDQEVVLVACHDEPDEEIASLLRRMDSRFVSYWSVVSGSHNLSDPTLQPNVWSLGQQRRERLAVSRLMDETGAKGVIVSAGTPGQFAGASGASVHSIYILHTYPHGRRQLVLGPSFMARVFRSTRNFVAVSAFQKKAMIHAWRLKSRRASIRVIPNTAGDMLEARSLPSQPPQEVLTASWVESYKDPGSWLATARTVIRRLGEQSVRFRWLGEGSLLDEFRQRVAVEALYPAVDFEGYVEGVSRAYAKASVYLLMSTTENMSMSVIDSLRHGLPSVVANVRGPNGIIAHGSTGFVIEPGDVDDAVRNIERLLSDSKFWIRMSEEGQRHYSRFFSPERWYSDIRDLHDQVFSSGRRL